MEIGLALLNEGADRLFERGPHHGRHELLYLSPMYGHDVADSGVRVPRLDLAEIDPLSPTGSPAVAKGYDSSKGNKHLGAVGASNVPGKVQYFDIR